MVYGLCETMSVHECDYGLRRIQRARVAAVYSARLRGNLDCLVLYTYTRTGESYLWGCGGLWSRLSVEKRLELG